jgi:DNA mismatch repair ATPase MutS
LIVFLSAGVVGYLGWGAYPAMLSVPILFGIFLYLVRLSVDARYERDKMQAILEMNRDELKVLEGEWQHFREGNDFKDPGHAYAHDMDLFGKKSVFQLINRAVTGKGSELLAGQLKCGYEDVELANEAISELSRHPEWCQEYLAEGKVLSEGETERELAALERIEWTETVFQKLLRSIVPFSSIALTVLFAVGLVDGTVFGMYVVFVLSLMGRSLKQVNRLTGQVTLYNNQVKMFRRQLEHIRKLKVESVRFNSCKDQLIGDEYDLDSSLKKLYSVQEQMDYRMNILVGVLLNFFLAWDLRVCYQWERWHSSHAANLKKWEAELTQFEVWISGAFFMNNFPNNCFAEFHQEERVEIRSLGHPFVPFSKQVSNDVNLTKEEHFLIITGPNMAGKSTYLRSLGLTFILANAGFPVIASTCSIPKSKLYSSMRTSDDLTVESSYFHAELTRLRFIMDAIERGEKVLIILDEILKGTNSKDKEIGSAKFLQKLVKLKAKGAIATHDLSLCELALNDRSFHNMYFDSTIDGQELSFDYRIREGICQNMNASFLLKKMQLVD